MVGSTSTARAILDGVRQEAAWEWASGDKTVEKLTNAMTNLEGATSTLARAIATEDMKVLKKRYSGREQEFIDELKLYHTSTMAHVKDIQRQSSFCSPCTGHEMHARRSERCDHFALGVATGGINRQHVSAGPQTRPPHGPSLLAYPPENTKTFKTLESSN